MSGIGLSSLPFAHLPTMNVGLSHPNTVDTPMYRKRHGHAPNLQSLLSFLFGWVGASKRAPRRSARPRSRGSAAWRGAACRASCGRPAPASAAQTPFRWARARTVRGCSRLCRGPVWPCVGWLAEAHPCGMPVSLFVGGPARLYLDLRDWIDLGETNVGRCRR